MALISMRQLLKATMVAMKDICVSRYEVFGTAGWADKIRVTSLEDMVLRYESGELDPQVN